MKSRRESLIDEALQSQKAIFLELHAAAISTWLHLDLTIAQIKGLFMLEAQGRMTVGGAAVELGIGKPAASILIDRLVQLGLVDRTEDSIDRRRAIVHLTPQAEDLITQLRQGRQERLRDSLAQIGDEDLEALCQGLRALASSSANRPIAHHDVGIKEV